MTKLSTYPIRSGISLIALAGLACLLAFASPASAHPRSSQVVVLEDAGAGSAPSVRCTALGRRRT